nr:MAG TPA: hypothetical protein [Caudoviricetes sp.]
MPNENLKHNHPSAPSGAVFCPLQLVRFWGHRYPLRGMLRVWSGLPRACM